MIERADQAEYLTADEVAELLRCQPEKVYRLCAAGRLPSFKFGGRRLIDRADLDGYIAALKSRTLAAVTPIGRR
jgi:excisionase family DNA binding protein